jgi:cytochrome P450
MSRRMNLMAPQVRANPYPFYAELRRRPVCQVDPGGLWAISRYDDVIAALKDTQRFSSEAYAERRRPDWFKDNPFEADSLVSLDPPLHPLMRSLVNHAFGPGAIFRMEPRVRAIAEGLVERAVQQKTLNFVADFALPLTASVICEMLGLDPTLHLRFKQWTDDIVQMISGPTPDQIPRIKTSIQDMARYFNEVIEARRAAPRDDLVSDLLRSKLDGRTLTQQEILSFLRLLLTAGLETTTHLLSSAMLVLSNHPNELERVRADGRLIPVLIQEVLRYEPPIHGILRRTTEPVEIGEARIPERELALILVASASRDEKHFPEPDAFQLDRQAPGSLPFGHGIHVCLGAALARMETRVALGVLVPRVRGISCAADDVSWIYSLNVRGPAALPLRLEAA